MSLYNRIIRRQIVLITAFLVPMFTIVFSTGLLGASANSNTVALNPTTSNAVGCEGGGPTVLEGPTPPPTEPLKLLVAYDFDGGQVDNHRVDNTVVPLDASWMAGLLSGNWQLRDIRNTHFGNKALLLKKDSESFVTVDYGEMLEFVNGLHVEAKICFTHPLSNSAYIIASQMSNWNAGEARWRLSIDKIPRTNRYALYFWVWLETGVAYARRDLTATDLRTGQWNNISGSYDDASGTIKVFWNQFEGENKVPGQNMRLREDPIRIGSGANTSLAFVGMIDEVRIWGTKPQCYPLETEASPAGGGTITVTPPRSQTPFCPEMENRYPPGERVALLAEPESSPVFFFYKWLGNLNYIDGAADQKYDITIVTNGGATVTAQFLSQAESPILTRFPVFGLHNTSIDLETCPTGVCELFCGLEAKAASNDACHDGAQDIHAEAGTPVIAAQDGTILFGCNEKGGNWVTITQGEFTHHYTHLDRACFQDADSTNLCTTEPNIYTPTASINCPVYFTNGSVVTAGMTIGTVGNSGSAIDRTPHLHYQLQTQSGFYCGGENEMDPFPFLYILEASSCESNGGGNPTIISFTATPDNGNNPLPVTLSWAVENPGEGGITCVLDPGDGSTPYIINDCNNNTIQTHTYNVENAYVATLTVEGDFAEAIIRVAKWSFESQYEIFSSPALNANHTNVYYTVMGELIALDTADGSTEWTYSTDWNGPATSPVVGADGTIYFATPFSLYAIYPDGNERWIFEYPSATWGHMPAVGYDGTIYIESNDDQGYGSTDCSLYAINPQGIMLWRRQLGTMNCQASDPVVNGNMIYTWYEDDNTQQLYAVDPGGNIVWTYEGTGYIPPIFNAVGQVVIMEGNQMRGIDANTGIVVWTNTFPFTAGCSSLAMASDGTIYIVDSQGFLHATFGSLLRWSIDIDGGCSSPAIGSDGTVYVGSNDHQLYAISYGGSVLWAFTTGGIIESSPNMGGGAIYIGSTDGALYAIESDAVLNNGPWPKYRRDTANSGHGG